MFIIYRLFIYPSKYIIACNFWGFFVFMPFHAHCHYVRKKLNNASLFFDHRESG